MLMLINPRQVRQIILIPIMTRGVMRVRLIGSIRIACMLLLILPIPILILIQCLIPYITQQAILAILDILTTLNTPITILIILVDMEDPLIEVDGEEGQEIMEVAGTAEEVVVVVVVVVPEVVHVDRKKSKHTLLFTCSAISPFGYLYRVTFSAN